MGFKRSALLLEWPENSEFSGLEVRMRRLSIGQLSHVQGLADLRKDGMSDTAQVFSDLLDAIAEGLLGWNYEVEQVQEDGTKADVPVPATREGLDGCDVDMVVQLTRAWLSAAAAVPLASPPSSPTGEPEPPDAEWQTWLASSQEPSRESSPAPV